MTNIEKGRISEVSARDTVQVHLPDGRVLEGRRGMHLEEFMNQIGDIEAPLPWLSLMGCVFTDAL
jgi:hypothetical protein